MRLHPGVSVVIPARITDRASLIDTIRSLSSRHVREVVVVDDASDPDIESWIYESIDATDFRLYVHTNTGNLGPSIARNLGARITTSEKILFVDADVVLAPDCIDRLVDHIEKHPGSICQPQPINRHAGEEEERVGHHDLLTSPYEDLTEGGELAHLYSFCFLIERTVFFEQRGFSSFFTITHEDIEFGIRLRAAGHSIWCVEGAVAVHEHPFEVDEYINRCIRNGDSFARLADTTGDRGYHDYRVSVSSHQFKTPIDALESTYRELRREGRYDEATWSELTKHYWRVGFDQYYASPQITVAVPVTGDTKRLPRTLRSIAKQSFTNFEVIVVHTPDVDVSGIAWDHAIPLRTIEQTTGRLSKAMNMAREAAEGRFFTWVQCGDYVGEHYLRRLVNEFFLDPSTAISFCGYKFFGLTENVDGWYKYANDPTSRKDLVDTFRKWNIVGPGFMVRLENDVAYNEENWLAEDWDFYLRNSLHGRIRFVDAVLYFYLDHADSLSRQVGWRADDASALERDNAIAVKTFERAIAAQTVAAGYVVRNESFFIEQSIRSIISHVDCVCVIDTGSTDGTIDIVTRLIDDHELGNKIRLHHRDIYNYNVSRYRNEVAELVDTDWIFIVDGDEIWPESEVTRLVAALRSEQLYQKECVNVFQKRWANFLEQQTNFVYIGSLIRAYRRRLGFTWRQSETIDFFIDERRYENLYMQDPDRHAALEFVDAWLTEPGAGIELQSVEYPYRNTDGSWPDQVVELDVYFDHFSRCKGEHYLRDRARRIHEKFLGTLDYLSSDRSFNGDYETFIPLKQHEHVEPGLSIVIPHFRHRDGLNRCLRSISENPPGVPFELLVVNDDPSQPLGAEALEESGVAPKVLNLSTRLGYGHACNEGIRAARFDHICLLNDDTIIVSEGWARTILDAMATDPAIAVAGPLTNRTGGYPPIQYEAFSNARFEDTEKIVDEIKDWAFVEIPGYSVLSGFCYFLKRAALVKTGLLDTDRYPWGYGEENDLTKRLLDEGYKGILVRSVFVWHELGQTFDAAENNPVVDLQHVKRRNIDKVIRLAKPRLVAYARAKNEALIIEEQLRRMLGFCDEVFILDTGSTDETARIARSFRRVHVVEMSDSVLYNAAVQLNISLQLARSRSPDWLLYFDVDQFYDANILYEIDTLLTDDEVDIWSFRLYDGRFCADWDDQQYNLDFIHHTRRLCEPCYRIVPTLYRNSKELYVADPVDWNAWARGDRSSGATLPPEHCVLPIQYIDPGWRGHFADRRVANSIIRHLGNCVSLDDLRKKKAFYTGHESHSDYADDWREFEPLLPREKLMNWKEREGEEVDIGSNLVKYTYWDKDPSRRVRFSW